MNEEKIKSKSVSILQELVRINTTNEDAEEYQAALYIQKMLQDHKIHTKIIYSSKKRANLVATIKSNNPILEPLVLLSHLDVVSSGKQAWKYPPFSGKEAEDCIWGRGTLDTKQLTVMHIMAFIKLSENTERLNRDVYLVSTADEENGSKEGMDFLVNEHPELFQDATVLSEGGGFTLSTKKENYMLFAAGEKGSAIVKFTAIGAGGHAGSPPTDQAIKHIAILLRTLFLQENKTESYQVLLKFEKEFLNFLENEELDESQAFLPKLYEYMKYQTHTIHEIKVGEELNVIPYKGELYVEFRIQPYTSEKSFSKYLTKLIKDHSLEFEVIQFQRGYESDINHEVVKLFEKYSSSYGFSGKWVPFTALGKTDGRFISTLAKNIYGISPVTIPFSEVLTRIHNVNERIEVDAFMFGVQLMRKVVTEFCMDNKVSKLSEV